METVLLDEVVETDYGQLDLRWTWDGVFDGDWDRSFAGQVNGLVGAANPHGMYVNLARRSGGSGVRIVLHDVAPAVDAEAEDVVEVSVVVAGEPHWETWGGMGGGELELPDGSYRVRVGATGRDEGAADEFAEEVLDRYVIDLWPADPEPDAILRTTSENAAYWHREIGSRR
ncbi:hypothetical protein GCM10027418_20840 [Mariniluteicoccus endophyticus]